MRDGWILAEHPTRRQINMQRVWDMAALGRARATGDADESLRLIRARTEEARWDMTVCLFEEQRDHTPPMLAAAWSMPIAADGPDGDEPRACTVCRRVDVPDGHA